MVKWNLILERFGQRQALFPKRGKGRLEAGTTGSEMGVGSGVMDL